MYKEEQQMKNAQYYRSKATEITSAYMKLQLADVGAWDHLDEEQFEALAKEANDYYLDADADVTQYDIAYAMSLFENQFEDIKSNFILEQALTIARDRN
jgi:hypothetical protein